MNPRKYLFHWQKKYVSIYYYFLSQSQAANVGKVRPFARYSKQWDVVQSWVLLPHGTTTHTQGWKGKSSWECVEWESNMYGMICPLFATEEAQWLPIVFAQNTPQNHALPPLGGCPNCKKNVPGGVRKERPRYLWYQQTPICRQRMPENT